MLEDEATDDETKSMDNVLREIEDELSQTSHASLTKVANILRIAHKYCFIMLEEWSVRKLKSYLRWIPAATFSRYDYFRSWKEINDDDDLSTILAIIELILHVGEDAFLQHLMELLSHRNLA